MVESEDKPKEEDSSLLRRFLHLLSAFSVEAILGPIFFLGLAWHNASLYGDIMYAIMAGGIVMIAVQFGLYAPLVRELSDKASQAKEVLVRYTWIRLFILAISIIVASIAVRAINLSSHLAIMVVIVAFGRGLKEIGLTFIADLRVRALQRREGRIVMIAVSIAFFYAFASLALGLGPEALSIYLFIWGLLMAVLGYRAVKEHHGSIFSTPIDRSLIKPTLGTGVLFALIALLRLGYHHTTIFFLERSAGSKAIAYYCASLGVVDITILIVSNLYLEAVFFPAITKMWDKEKSQTLAAFRSNAIWLMAITVPITYLLYTKSSFIIGTIYPPSYVSSIFVLKCMAFTIPLLCLNAVFYNFLIVSKQERTLLVLSFIAFFVNLGLNVLFVRDHGIQGAALIPVFTSLFRVAQYLIVCQMRYGLFRILDLFMPLLACLGIVGLHKLTSLVLPLHVDIIVAVIAYAAILLVLHLLNCRLSRKETR